MPRKLSERNSAIELSSRSRIFKFNNPVNTPPFTDEMLFILSAILRSLSNPKNMSYLSSAKLLLSSQSVSRLDSPLKDRASIDDI